MELKHLEAFIALTQYKNFGKAAKVLFISQSALSKRIIELERETGAKLFDRSWQTITLTAAGRNFQPKAVRAISSLRDLQITVDDERKTVIVGFTAQIMKLFSFMTAFQLAEKRFTQAYNFRAEVIATSMNDAIGSFENGNMHLAFIWSHDVPEFPHYKSKILFESSMCMLYNRSCGDSVITDRRQISEYLENKTVITYDSQMRSSMHLYLMLSELGVSSIKMTSVDNDVLAVLRTLGNTGVMFIPKCHMMQYFENEAVKRELDYVSLPIPSARVYCVLAWNDNDQDVDDFAQYIIEDINHRKIWEQWGQENAYLPPINFENKSTK